jgi:hypothetical protein
MCWFCGVIVPGVLAAAVAAAVAIAGFEAGGGIFHISNHMSMYT